ncbi:MAG: hypothetical protein IT384_15230 [Deltaproteobacteria bacterium]|nr:hypothetical protein [Deltaproteobacteria bacterium]
MTRFKPHQVLIDARTTPPEPERRAARSAPRRRGARVALTPRAPADPRATEAFLATLGPIARGDVSPARAWAVSDEALGALARLGAALYRGSRFEDAAQVFEALAAIDPSEPRHRAHLAYALRAARQGGVA